MRRSDLSVTQLVVGFAWGVLFWAMWGAIWDRVASPARPPPAAPAPLTVRAHRETLVVPGGCKGAACFEPSEIEEADALPAAASRAAPAHPAGAGSAGAGVLLPYAVRTAAERARPPACNGAPYGKQVYYGIANVYARVKGRKIDDQFNDEESPPLKSRDEAQSLRMCELQAPENVAAARVAAERHDGVRAMKAAMNALQASPDPRYTSAPRELLTEAFGAVGAADWGSILEPAGECGEALTIAFFMRDQVGAPLIRGFMMADYLKKRGHATQMVLAKRGAGNPEPLKELQACPKVDVCIFIKWYARAFPSLVKECKARGALVLIDFMDYCNTHIKNVLRYWPKAVDGFIAQSRHQLAYYHALNYTRSVLIYHPQTNLHSRVVSLDRPVRTVGYTGHWRNMGAENQAIFKHIEAWGAPRGIEFKTIDYFKFNGVVKGKDDTYKQGIYHYAVDEVDIAIIWPAEMGDLEFYFKPVTRFIYWLSHGIPVIFYPTQVYSEVALAAGYPLAATTPEEVEFWMTRLVESPAFRREVAEIGIRAAAHFSVEATAARYEEALCSYAAGGQRAALADEAPRSVYNGARFI